MTIIFKVNICKPYNDTKSYLIWLPKDKILLFGSAVVISVKAITETLHVPVHISYICVLYDELFAVSPMSGFCSIGSP